MQSDYATVLEKLEGGFRSGLKKLMDSSGISSAERGYRLRELSDNLIDIAEKKSRDIKGSFYPSLYLGSVCFPEYEKDVFFVTGFGKRYMSDMKGLAREVGIPKKDALSYNTAQSHVKKAVAASRSKRTVDAYIKSNIVDGKLRKVYLSVGFKSPPMSMTGNVSRGPDGSKKMNVYMTSAFKDTMEPGPSEADFVGIGGLNELSMYEWALHMDLKKFSNPRCISPRL